MRIGVDLMGGDQPPHVIYDAALLVADQLPDEERVVVFTTHELGSSLGAHPRIECITTDQAIEMDELPLQAVRRKRNSTLAAGMRLLREGEIQAFVSAGNTGALVATARLHLAPLPGVQRPALLVMMPAEGGEVAVLDVGANINPKPLHLATYAKLASLYREHFHAISAPRIGLLNIGAEAQKGTPAHKETYQLLKEGFGEHFLGNIEGREVFQGKIDVLVTDGFTGNVFLKTSEGISTFLVDYLQKHFNLKSITEHLHQKYDYSEQPGALLLGVDGLVIKCHGYSDLQALANGISGARSFARMGIIEKLQECLIA